MSALDKMQKAAKRLEKRAAASTASSRSTATAPPRAAPPEEAPLPGGGAVAAGDAATVLASAPAAAAAAAPAGTSAVLQHVQEPPYNRVPTGVGTGPRDYSRQYWKELCIRVWLIIRCWRWRGPNYEWIDQKELERELQEKINPDPPFEPRNPLVPESGTLHDWLQQRADVEVVPTAGSGPRDWKYRPKWKADAGVAGIRCRDTLLAALRRADPLEPRGATDGDVPERAGLLYDDLCRLYKGVEGDLRAAVADRRVICFSPDPRHSRLGDKTTCDERRQQLIAEFCDAVPLLHVQCSTIETMAVYNIVHGRRGYQRGRASTSGLVFYHLAPGPEGVFAHLLLAPPWVPGGEARELWGGGAAEPRTATAGAEQRAAVYTRNLNDAAVAPFRLTDEATNAWAGGPSAVKRRRGGRWGPVESNAHMRDVDREGYPWCAGGVVYDFLEPYSREAAEQRYRQQRGVAAAPAAARAAPHHAGGGA